MVRAGVTCDWQSDGHTHGSARQCWQMLAPSGPAPLLANNPEGDPPEPAAQGEACGKGQHDPLTPEQILDALEARFGDDPVPARDVWLFLVEHLAGERTNWTKRTVKALKARTVYELRGRGWSITRLVAHLRMSRRTVERLYTQEMLRRRRGDAA